MKLLLLKLRLAYTSRQMILPVDIDNFTLITWFGYLPSEYSIQDFECLFLIGEGSTYKKNVPREFLNMTQMKSINFAMLTHNWKFYDKKNLSPNHKDLNWINFINIIEIMFMGNDMYSTHYGSIPRYKILKV